MNVLLKSGRLLDENGELIAAGFAFDLVREYRKSDVIKQSKLKEVNKYYIINSKFALNLIVSHGYYDSYVDINFTDFENNKSINKTKIKYFNDSRIAMTASSKIGSIEFAKKDFSVEIYNDYEQRKIIFAMKNFDNKKDFYCIVDLEETTNGSSVLASPFKGNGEFAYNQRIACQKVKGYINIGSSRYDFDSYTRAVFEWSRCVFPVGNMSWNFASASGIKNDKEVGFVFAHGGYNDEGTSPNMFFYDCHAYKLNDVILTPSSKMHKYTEEWEITSKDNQIKLIFAPIANSNSKFKNLFEFIDRKIIYGNFKGYVMFDKDKIEISNLLGFIEINENKY